MPHNFQNFNLSDLLEGGCFSSLFPDTSPHVWNNVTFQSSAEKYTSRTCSLPDSRIVYMGSVQNHSYHSIILAGL